MGAAALAIGTGIQAYSSIKQGQAQRTAYLAEAQSKRAAAAQTQISTDYEIRSLERRYERTKGAQISAIGRSGVQLSGSPLLELENAAADAATEIAATRAAGNYRKQALLTEAGGSETLAGESLMAGFLGGAGSILTGIQKNPYTYDAPRQGGITTGS